MSDYQKLKAEYDELKAKNEKQGLLIRQLRDVLMTTLDYNNFVKNKVVRLLGLMEGELNEPR